MARSRVLAVLGGGGGGGGPSTRRGRGAPADSGDFDISDLRGGSGDIFSSIFVRRGQVGPGATPNLKKVETEVTIPFRVAAQGGTVPITLVIARGLSDVRRDGGGEGRDVNTCPECKGRERSRSVRVDSP